MVGGKCVQGTTLGVLQWDREGGALGKGKWHPAGWCQAPSQGTVGAGVCVPVTLGSHSLPHCHCETEISARTARLCRAWVPGVTAEPLGEACK